MNTAPYGLFCACASFPVAWLIYWFLAVLIGTAGIALYFFYKFFTDKALYYTAYFL